MGWLDTSLSSLAKIGTSIGGAIASLSPAVQAAATVYSAFQGGASGSTGGTTYTPAQSYQPGYGILAPANQAAIALPGGAPVMSYAGGGAQMAGFPDVTQYLSPWVQNLIGPGGNGGNGGAVLPSAGCIVPIPRYNAQGQLCGARMPKLVNVPSPADPNRIETYVRAPAPRYKVMVSGPRKRRACSGG